MFRFDGMRLGGGRLRLDGCVSVVEVHHITLAVHAQTFTAAIEGIPGSVQVFSIAKILSMHLPSNHPAHRLSHDQAYLRYTPFHLPSPSPTMIFTLSADGRPPILPPSSCPKPLPPIVSYQPSPTNPLLRIPAREPSLALPQTACEPNKPRPQQQRQRSSARYTTSSSSASRGHTPFAHR